MLPFEESKKLRLAQFQPFRFQLNSFAGQHGFISFKPHDRGTIALEETGRGAAGDFGQMCM